jgi:hypothetical protein
MNERAAFAQVFERSLDGIDGINLLHRGLSTLRPRRRTSVGQDRSLPSAGMTRIRFGGLAAMPPLSLGRRHPD